MKTEVFIRREFEWAGVGIYILQTNEKGERFLAEPMDLVLKQITLGERQSPTIQLDEFHAKGFLDSLASELIKLGYAPDAIKAKAGELEAAKYHLEDMRTLVFKGGKSGAEV